MVFLDDLGTFLQLLFGDDQGRGKPDDVLVGGFGQQAVFLQRHTNIPGGLSIGGFDHNGIEQSFAPAPVPPWVNRFFSVRP